MAPPTIYLGGPINGCTDDESNGWREGFMKRLPMCGFLDPMRRDYRGREDECVEEIVTGDQADVADSDVILAYAWQASVGTSMEIHFTNTAECVGLTLGRHPDRDLYIHKHVLTVVPEGVRVSPWLRYFSDLILPTLEDAAQWIETKYGL